MDRKPTKRNDGVGEDTGHVSRSSIHKVATRTRLEPIVARAKGDSETGENYMTATENTTHVKVPRVKAGGERIPRAPQAVASQRIMNSAIQDQLTLKVSRPTKEAKRALRNL